MNNVGIETLIDEANAARSSFISVLKPLVPAQAAFKPSPDVWSITEIAEHLVLAEQGCIHRVWSAAEALRHGHPVWTGDAIHRGKSIEEAVAETWAAKQSAPSVALPRRAGSLGFWIEALNANRSLLAALPPVLDGLDPAEVITPHPISGPWDARQWIAFIGFHLNRHQRQVERVRETPGFPA